MGDEFHRLKTGEVLKKLDSSEKGISKEDALERIKKHGYNQLRKKKGISPVKIFLSQFTSFLVIILILAVVFSFLIGEVLDATVILVVVIVNAIFGFVQEYRAEKAIEALKKLTTPETLVLREGKIQEIASRLLVPGDVVLIEEGTRIPADMRVIESVEMEIDEASLTGESRPVRKIVEAIGEAGMADRKNIAYMGTLSTYGRGRGVVINTGMDTEMGKIAAMIEEVDDESTPLQRRLASFGRKLGVIILIISGIVIAAGLLRNYELFSMILTGIALAVAAIPEGLPAVVTITLALGLQRLSKKNALVRRLPAVETLGSTSVICADKTGTLTKNEMTVKKIWFNKKNIEVTGTGFIPQGQFLLEGKKINPEAISLLLRTGILCNNAEVMDKGIAGDPTEGAILIAGAKGLPISEVRKKYKRVHEIPFSSERKLMSTVNKSGSACVYSKGAVEVVLEKCERILLGDREVKLTPEIRKEILEKNKSLSGEALRVLGFAYKEVEGREIRESEVEEGLTFLGMMGMIDPPREGVRDNINICKKAGIRTVMITGDHRNTALAIAKEIGIWRPGDIALTGEELDKISDSKLEWEAEKISVYARVNPSHKVRIVKALKRKGRVVAMTGDGVNDAPALKRADIGVAMGIKGTDVAKEASDMILTDDNFTSIVSSVREGRGIYDNINHFIRYLLSSNISEVLIIFLALIFLSSPGEALIPLIAVQILWVNLVTDGLPALALGVDPPAKGIMERKPRPPGEKLLNRRSLSFIIWVGIIITAGTLWIFYTEYQIFGLVKAQTMAFTSLVMFEMFNVFNVRKGLGFFSNRKLLLAVTASIILQVLVIYLPPLQQAFGTVSLGLLDWGKIILVSLSVLVIMQVKARLTNKRPLR
jgi:Ca2+-transporting ATPase